MATNFSNWRCVAKILEPGLNEITFLDTRPNVFFIINNNPTYLYAGLESIPNNIKYEHLIKPNDTDIMGRPIPVSRIYIFNPKNITLTVKIFSDYTHFDIGLLKTIYARMDDDQLEKIKYDGVITGWQTPDVVNTFITNYDDLLEPINENIDNNTNIIYTLMDDFKNSIQDKIIDLIDVNINASNNLCTAFVGTNRILSNINKSIINLTDYSSYLISGINKMNTAIGLLDNILNKKCTCNGNSSTEPGPVEPEPGPVEPDDPEPPYDKNDYIIDEQHTITNNDTVILNNVERVLSISITCDNNSSIPCTETEIIATNKSMGPVKLNSKTTIYYPFNGTVEIYNNGLLPLPPQHYPINLNIKYVKNGIKIEDIPAITPPHLDHVFTKMEISPDNPKTLYNASSVEITSENITNDNGAAFVIKNANTNKNYGTIIIYKNTSKNLLNELGKYGYMDNTPITITSVTETCTLLIRHII